MFDLESEQQAGSAAPPSFGAVAESGTMAGPSTDEHVPGESPLGRIIDRIEQAFASGDFDLTVRLLEQDTLAAWYGLQPERLREIIETLDRAQAPIGLFLRAISAMLAGPGESGRDPDELGPEAQEFAATSQDASLAARMFRLRLQGRPVEAMRYATDFSGNVGVLQPLFDVQRGWGLFGAVQVGVTAMLAGDFNTAMASFTQARMHVVVPHLAFLTRDAKVKAAVLEALYGDVQRAAALLEEAERVPRTESWAEGLLDACVAIAESLIRAPDPATALRTLDSVPLRDVGEMWPFYVAAIHRALLAAGDLAESNRRAEMFEQFPLPRAEGQGYVGSVLPLMRAWDAIAQGDLQAAREQLERADSSIVVSRLTSARLELAAGRPREALEFVEGLHEQTSGFRALELQRLGLIAGSQLALGAAVECREVLEFALSLQSPLEPHDAWFFSVEVHQFAATAVAGWPFSGMSEGWDDDFPTSVPLTARELDVLKDLASGRSREEIASQQYISLNTLKAHLRSIYRKLNVNSRSAAVLEAERRGLFL